MHRKKNNNTIRKVTIGILLVLVVSAVAWYYMNQTDSNKSLPNDVAVVVDKTTTLEVVPKTSKDDNDLEVTQRYKANINGATMEVPVVSKGIAKDGTKAAVTQEVDMTKVLNHAVTLERNRIKQEYQKNWEFSVGVGNHSGSFYVPLEIQRNYAKDKAISFEIHIDTATPLRANGWEVKHTWKF